MINKKAIEQLVESFNNTTIVAATKNKSIEEINGLKDFGITIAGENRVQEFLNKYPFVKGIEWHFIGRLQTNKVKYIIDKVKLIQSVDRLPLIEEIEKQCKRFDTRMSVLLELNMGEETKGGADKDQIFDLAGVVASSKYLDLKGLMCLPSPNCTDETYIEIKQIFDKLKDEYPQCKYLSVGTSVDYKKAVKYGANMIRPGSVLFDK